jgi:hypothetical protein
VHGEPPLRWSLQACTGIPAPCLEIGVAKHALSLPKHRVKVGKHPSRHLQILLGKKYLQTPHCIPFKD